MTPTPENATRGTTLRPADPAALAELVAELDAPRTGKAKGRGRKAKEAADPATEETPAVEASKKAILDAIPDDDLLKWARNAKNGRKFAALYDDGSTAGHPSASEADIALLCLLVYWTGGDAARVARLFLASALGRRQKITERPDYLARSIAAAIRFNAGNAPDLTTRDGSIRGMKAVPKPPPSRPRWRGSSGDGEARPAAGPATNGDGQAADDRPDDDDQAGAVGAEAGPAITPNEAADDPHRLARLYRDNRCSHPDGLTLCYHRDEWHRWDDAAYRVVRENQLRAELAETIKPEFDRLNVEAIVAWERRGRVDERGKPCPCPTARKVTAQLVGNVALNLSGLALLDSRAEQPSWLDGSDPFPAADVLPARNCLIHLPGFVQGQLGAILPPTPRFFASWALDYDFRPDAPEPVAWLKFLRQLWPHDRQAIDTLQEWLGYSLTPDTRQQKILALIGPKRSGKGTIARIHRALIGSENVASPTLAGLASHFGLAPLIGKPLAIISDARLSGRSDQAVIVENLLRISGEDAVTIDRKHISAWSGKLPSRIVLIANELPRLSDSSGALAGRLILLRFVHSFYGKEDHGLTDRLMAELPSILLWAIAGWQRLRERGRFVQPDSGREMVEEMEDLASPVGAFLKERCIIEPGQTTRADDLFTAWRDWCDWTGRKFTGTSHEFGRDLRAVLPQLKSTQPRRDGGRKRWYEGIGLKSESRADPAPELAALLKARLDAGQMGVRESVEAAGQAGHLKREPDGKWDARPLWDAGRRLGFAPVDPSATAGPVITDRGKVWAPAPRPNDPY